MSKTLEQIVREAARSVLSVARFHGFDLLAHRAPFTVSDLAKLENEILIWMQDHMEPAEGDLDEQRWQDICAQARALR